MVLIGGSGGGGGGSSTDRDRPRRQRRRRSMRPATSISHSAVDSDIVVTSHVGTVYIPQQEQLGRLHSRRQWRLFALDICDGAQHLH
jgi:hypothetical protein